MVINKFESTHIVAQNTKLNEILLFLWILTLMKPKTQDMNQREMKFLFNFAKTVCFKDLENAFHFLGQIAHITQKLHFWTVLLPR